MGGLNFVNTLGQNCIENRGIGILANSSDFNVSRSGNQLKSEANQPSESLCDDNGYNTPKVAQPCTFEKLGYGIKFNGATDNSNRPSIRYAEFTNNYYDILIDHTEDGLIHHCNSINDISTMNSTFTIGSLCSSPSHRYIVRCQNTEGVRIIDNSLADDTYAINFIELENPISQGRVLINANDFTSTRSGALNTNPVYGISVKNAHTQCRITCNNFDNLSNDIRIESGASLNDMWYGSRAKNNYSSAALYNINNLGTVPIETWNSSSCSGNNPSLVIINQSSPYVPDQDLCKLSCNQNMYYLGVEKIKKNNFGLYPNPAKDFIEISSLENLNKADIKIYNVLGMEVWNKNNSIFPTIIDIKEW